MNEHRLALPSDLQVLMKTCHWSALHYVYKPCVLLREGRSVGLGIYSVLINGDWYPAAEHGSAKTPQCEREVCQRTQVNN